jgi:hypothetical protein
VSQNSSAEVGSNLDDRYAWLKQTSLFGIGDDPAGRKILPQYLPKSHANARPEGGNSLDAPADGVVSQSGRSRRWPSEP